MNRVGAVFIPQYKIFAGCFVRLRAGATRGAARRAMQADASELKRLFFDFRRFSGTSRRNSRRRIVEETNNLS
jgi:hypothetical protein